MNATLALEMARICEADMAAAESEEEAQTLAECYNGLIALAQELEACDEAVS